MNEFILPKITKLSYCVSCDSYANISNALNVWIKFTGYFSEEEIAYINELDQIPLYLIEIDKIKIYWKLRERMELYKLLLKYKNKDCTPEEHDKVVAYMHNTSLRNLVNNSVSEEEKKRASLILNDLITIEDLRTYIKFKEKDYVELSIYDAYILFYAKEKLFNIEQIEFNEKIRNEQIKGTLKLKKI